MFVVRKSEHYKVRGGHCKNFALDTTKLYNRRYKIVYGMDSANLGRSVSVSAHARS